MEKSKMIEKLKKFYAENPEDFANDIEYLSDENECLGFNRCYPMYLLNEHFECDPPYEILKRAFYGIDDDGDTFNPDRAYFCYDYDGGISSTDKRDYRRDYLNDANVKDIIDNAAKLDLSDGAKAIINGQN